MERDLEIFRAVCYIIIEFNVDLAVLESFLHIGEDGHSLTSTGDLY